MVTSAHSWLHQVPSAARSDAAHASAQTLIYLSAVRRWAAVRLRLAKYPVNTEKQDAADDALLQMMPVWPLLAMLNF